MKQPASIDTVESTFSGYDDTCVGEGKAKIFPINIFYRLCCTCTSHKANLSLFFLELTDDNAPASLQSLSTDVPIILRLVCQRLIPNVSFGGSSQNVL